MRKLLVLGETGQVARALARSARASGVEVVTIGRATLDLAEADGNALLARHRPDAVINAAAYTAVDRAEREEAQANRLNRDMPDRFARACAERDLPFIHLSTDYVFDGEKATPYLEDDRRAPINAYGRSKAAGEMAVEAAGGRFAILRTSWVFSAIGANFVRTMLRLAQTQAEVAVVADQIGRPTPATDVAVAALRLASSMSADADVRDMFHVAGEGDATWADFAESIFASSSACDGPTARVRRVNSGDRPAPARRPGNSRLGGRRLQDAIGWSPHDWRVGLDACVRALLREHATEPTAGAGTPQLASPDASL